jgi:hypothetical protein
MGGEFPVCLSLSLSLSSSLLLLHSHSYHRRSFTSLYHLLQLRVVFSLFFSLSLSIDRSIACLSLSDSDRSIDRLHALCLFRSLIRRPAAACSLSRPVVWPWPPHSRALSFEYFLYLGMLFSLFPLEHSPPMIFFFRRGRRTIVQFSLYICRSRCIYVVPVVYVVLLFGRGPRCNCGP